MNKTETMSKFKKLWVWQQAIDFAAAIYELTDKGKFAKDFGFRNQIQRAVVSIASNIAEGDERDSDKQSVYFFKIAKASNAEVITQLNIAQRIDYIDKNTLLELETLAMKIGAGLYGLIKARGGYK